MSNVKRYPGLSDLQSGIEPDKFVLASDHDAEVERLYREKADAIEEAVRLRSRLAAAEADLARRFDAERLVVSDMADVSDRLAAADWLLRDCRAVSYGGYNESHVQGLRDRIDAFLSAAPAGEKVSPIRCDHSGSSATLCTDGTTTFQCPKCGLDLKGCIADQPTVVVK